jgi:ATP-dependent protease ClpP protease subunit
MTGNLNYAPKIIEGRAYMLLNRQIGPDSENSSTPFIDGGKFADDMYALHAQGYPITVKINSPGGNISHGWNILEAVEATEADTHVYGMAASMAGMIALKGKNRTADAHALIMLHSPYNPSAKGKITAMIEALRAQFSTLITALTKIPGEISKKLMEGGDYLFNAVNSKTYGLIDQVIPSAVKFTAPANASISETYAAMSAAIEDSTETKNNMEKGFFAKLFGKATEEEAQISAVQLQNEVVQLKAKDAEKDRELVALKAQIAEGELKAKAVALIESAKAAGKFAATLKAEDEAKLVANAIANYDSVKIMIDNMATVKQEVAGAIITDKAGATMDYEWLMKNDPAKLQAIAESDAKLFNKLSDEYIEKQKAKK